MWLLFGLSVESQTYQFATIAGLAGTNSGFADGTNSNARFWQPYGITVDATNTIYTVDSQNQTIRQIKPVGPDWVVSTLAGVPGNVGGADGTNGAASFNSPAGIVVDASRNLFVADHNNYTIRKITPFGTNWAVTTVAGTAGQVGTSDGTNGAARFAGLGGIALDSAGNLYVTDGNKIRRLSPVGTNWVVTTIAGSGSSGSVDGTNSNARFNLPGGVAADSAGNLYVADTSNDTLRMIVHSGTNWVVTTIAGTARVGGSNNGTNGAGRFRAPIGIAVDAAGSLYVSDAGNNTIRQATPIGTNWVVTTLAGLPLVAGSSDGLGTNAQFYYPLGIAVEKPGHVVVADTDNNTVRRGYVVPSVQCVLSSNQLVLSWPLAAADFAPEAAHSLLPSALWTNLTSPRATNAGNIYITNTFPVSPSFFRLRLQ